MNVENQSDTALLMNLTGRAGKRESTHYIRLIFGRFIIGCLSDKYESHFLFLW